MLSKEVTVFKDEPYTHGYIDNVLLDPSLMDYFPPEKEMRFMTGKTDTAYRHHKWHLNKSHENFQKNLGTWKPFYEWVIGGGFKDWGKEVFGVKTADKGRMEFSSLPAKGGNLFPHTDAKLKVFVMVIFLPGYEIPFDVGPTMDGPWTPVPFKPNRAPFFLRSDDSWHKVGPGEGPEGKWRHTLTLNLVKIHRKNKLT